MADVPNPPRPWLLLQLAAAVEGLAVSSLVGAKLYFKPARQSFRPKITRTGGVVAKYGEKSVSFDLEDLLNTTGQWGPSKFFETFAVLFTKSGLLLKFLILGGGSLLGYGSATASDDILPIKKAPQLPPKKGPRGKILINCMYHLLSLSFSLFFFLYRSGSEICNFS